MPLGLIFIMASLVFQGSASAQSKPEKMPNIILINCDDLGWAEVSCYGSKWKTPNIDRIAENGVLFTSFYSGNAFCTPSRAALLTGSYASRTGFREVLFNTHEVGLNPDEFTIAEMFKNAGYVTACVGKWHLGNRLKFLPLNHGFDEFYGIPYSHDMIPSHPHQEKWNFPELPLIKGNEKVGEIKDLGILTNIFTNYAVDFIKRNSASPFFLYLPYSMPHTPLAVTRPFKGISGHGLIGDVITEIDWGVGEIFKILETYDILKNTILIFTSDNGSPRDNHTPGPFRGGKGTTFEGGSRVPFLISWPGVIPEGKVNKEIASQMDLLPTFANLLNENLSGNEIDGVGIWDLFMCKNTESKHEQIYFFIEEQVQSLRIGSWKYHIPHLHIDRSDNIFPPKGEQKVIGESLFDLKNDIREQKNLISENPERTDSIRRIFQKWQKEFYIERRPIGTLSK